MKSYSEMLTVLALNKIPLVRWFTTDNIFCFQPVSEPTEKERAQMEVLFHWPDYFPQNKLWAIDMSKQDAVARVIKDDKVKKIRVFKEPKVEEQEFTLD